jgi:hypothetical protein
VATEETVQEALDNLLDPLDLSSGTPETAKENGGAHAMTPEVDARPPRADLPTVLFRLRRSRRLLYKLPRVFVAWTALIVGVCGLVWATFSIVGLR